MSIKGGYLIFIILLIGLNNLRADDEDTTEAISDNTEAITIQQQIIEDETKETLRNENEDEDEIKIENPTLQRLPADSESIRKNIIDSQFSCDEREPGFYADIENECQIFHRCLEGRNEVYSFICPEQTIFHQRSLVCIWEDDYNFDCASSERYYHESNRAFFGNATAEETMIENIKNSQEIKGVVEQTQIPILEEIKLFEIVPVDDELAVTNDESEMIEKNSLEEEKEVESVSEEMEESNDYQAELIPSSTNHIDASIATSSNSDFDLDSASFETNQPPQKLISLSVLDPIIEMPSDDQTQEPVTTMSRNIRKRAGSHRNRFLFKADAH